MYLDLEEVYGYLCFFLFHSLQLLKNLSYSVKNKMKTKTGMMGGLGETFAEVIDTMSQIVDLGVEIFNIGQYLQPSKKHLSVARYVEESEFNDYKQIGLEMGFKIVKSGSLVRSSYHADEAV